MKVGLWLVAGSLALASVPTRVWAAEGDPAPVGQEQVAAAEQLGGLLYAYDQAAWHGTDAFTADIQRTRLDTSWLRGFMVLPDDSGRLWAVFYGERDGVLVMAARYRVADGQVQEGGLLEGADIVPLSPAAVRMANMRQAAFSAMVDNRYGLCARSNPNTIVLPPDAAGAITVYVLTPPTTNDDYPLGGHYRFTFDAADKLVAHRRFLNSCFAIPRRLTGRRGEEPVGTFVTHLLDPQPTEIHFFVSR